jgi:hypothetical protein
MNIFRIASFTVTAALGLAALVGSTQNSQAGGLGLDWLANRPYVECVKRARMLADVSSIMRGPAYREQSYDAGRRQCNQRYYGHQ